MIAQLKGTIEHKDLRFLVLDVSGVGYKVFATSDTIESAKIGEVKKYWIHQVVREDAQDLYGFNTKDDQDFFELLIGISGIGPKTALGILNLATLPTLKRAVVSGDSSYLTKVSGIGKKNAEKIVLELKDKLIAVFDEEENQSAENHNDSLEALKSLGYSEREAREALKKIPANISDTSESVRQALKILSKQK